MFNAKQLLDALVGSAASRGGAQPGQGGFADVIGQVLGSLGGQGGQGQPAQGQQGQGAARPGGAGQAAAAPGGTDQLVQKAKDFVAQHPGMAEAALMSVAGILMGSRKTRGIAGSAVKLGGLALIGTLAYKAYQNYQSGKPLLGAAGVPGAGAGVASGAGAGTPAIAFDPARTSDDDALLFARAMVAAATADGRVDDAERARIATGLSQAGIDPQATRWLEDELRSPASIEDLSDGVNTPEKGAQVYAAARVAIDPDTIQEREFLRQLATALDLDQDLVRHIDDAAGSIRVPAGPA